LSIPPTWRRIIDKDPVARGLEAIAVGYGIPHPDDEEIYCSSSKCTTHFMLVPSAGRERQINQGGENMDNQLKYYAETGKYRDRV